MTHKVKKKYFLSCAYNKNSNQPAHPRSLIRVFVFRMKILCILGYPVKILTDCANAQADLNLYWAHMSEGTFYYIADQILQ